MIFKGFMTAVTAALLLSACSRIPDESKHIPRNAGIVLGINSKQVSQKLITNGVTMDKLFSALQQRDTANEAIKAWKDAENSGIDLTSNFFAAVVFNGPRSYVTVTGGLKDAAKFEAYLKQNAAKQETRNDFSYAWLQKDSAVVGWSGSTVIYLLPFDPETVKKRRMSMPGMPAPVSDSAGDNGADALVRPASLNVAIADDAGAWAGELDRLFHLKQDESAGSIDAFKDMLKQNGDMTFFVHPEEIYNNQPSMLPANFKKLMAGTYLTGNVNFEQGKVLVDSRSYAGDELAGIHKKYGSSEADLSMLEKYPSNDIVSFVAFGFDFRMLGDVIKSTGADGFINLMMGSSGLTMDDVLSAFRGQMVFVSSDFSVNRVPKDDAEDSSSVPHAKWLFSLKVGDKAAFEKVMTSPFVKNMFRQEGDKYVLKQSLNGISAQVTKDYVTAASDSDLLQQYLAGSGKATLDKGLLGKIKGNPLGVYVNFEKIASKIPDDEVPPQGKPLAAQARNLLKDLRVISHPFKDKQQDSEIELNFKNTQENSLAQLLNLGAAAAAYYKEKKGREDSLQSQGTDSTAPPQQ
jgi:hypothetical protein